jgi:hypothetical protein
MAVKASVLPLCQENKYTICAAQDDDASPSRRPFIKFHLRKNATSQTLTITDLYDTGAAVSLITPSDCEAIKRSGVVIGEIPGMTRRVQNVIQQPMQTEGAWRVRLYLKGRPLSAAMIVTNDVAQSIIGMNIIGPRRLVMDPVTYTVDFRDEGAAAAMGVHGQREDGTMADVRVLRATTIPGRHGQLLKLGLFNSERHRVHASVATLVDMDIMAAAVNTDAMGGFVMHIPNADYEDCEIKRGTLMGKAHKFADWMLIDANAAINMMKKPERVLRDHTREELEVIRKLITDNLNRTVPYQYWSEYIAMIMARQHFFSADNLDLGFTDLEQHTIDLKDKDPVFSPQFRLSAEHLKLIQENVAGWLQAGIIERSRSPYNSPIFCVPKKEGQGLRCVLDYRRVNSSSFSDRYALRTIDECLETVGRAGSKVYSALDCSSAIWQLELRPSDRPFTAFTLPGKGQYHWKTCPQGLMGAPASFSRLIDVLLADAKNVLTYIDDVLVHSPWHEEHLKHLSAAIDIIGAANL